MTSRGHPTFGIRLRGRRKFARRFWPLAIEATLVVATVVVLAGIIYLDMRAGALSHPGREADTPGIQGPSASTLWEDPRHE